MGRYVKCTSPRCDRLFPFSTGKKYCSSKCRNYADRARSVALAFEYLDTLPCIEPAYQAIFEEAGPWRILKTSIAIARKHPERAVGYRLGIG